MSIYCHLLQFSCIIIINARLINISMIETNSYIEFHWVMICDAASSEVYYYFGGLGYYFGGLDY